MLKENINKEKQEENERQREGIKKEEDCSYKKANMIAKPKDD